jgi:hypothetical protein
MALPITSFAAKQETYIKEIRISTGATADEAKKWLTDNGYIVVDVDLNWKTGKDCVYMGYKTTTNPDEAITDISLMQMNGGYSFSDYEAMIEKRKLQISDMINSLNVSLTEARANYSSGKKCAISAHEVLNRFKEDDSGKYLGDLLFVEAIDTTVLAKIFLQGNADITSLIHQMLAFACTDYELEESWLDKLQYVDVYEVEEELLNNGMLPYYDELASKMASSFTIIQDKIKYYETVCKPFDDNYSQEEFDALSFDEQLDYFPEDYNETVLLYAALSNYRYGDGTLKDFFMQEYDELDGEDFYPLYVTMTEGQRAILPFVDYTLMIALAENNGESAEKYVQSCLETLDYYEIKEVSVYTNVDRSLFDGGVALTNASLRKSASTGETPWSSDENIDHNLRVALNTVAGTAFGLAIGSVVVGAAVNAAMKSAVSAATAASRASLVALDKILIDTLWTACLEQGIEVPVEVGTNTFRTFAAGIERDLMDKTVLREGMASLTKAEASVTQAATAATTTARYQMMQRILTGANVVMMVAFGITLIAEGIKIGIKVYNHYHPEYTEIPRMIVDEVVTDSDSYYVNYYAVKDQTDKSGDLNAWSAQRWNALYTTTDKKAGDPIIASSLLIYLNDSEFPSEDHGAVHYFGETAAANVNRYQFKKTAPATYIFYERDHSLSMTASTFSGGQLVMFTGFGLLGGVAIGSLGVIGAGKLKKKEKEDIASADADR